jgi:hypothetical protein
VTALEARERRRRGIFSRTRACGRVPSAPRFSGQKSRRSRTTGSVTTMGFAMSPQEKSTATSRYLSAPGFLA